MKALRFALLLALVLSPVACSDDEEHPPWPWMASEGTTGVTPYQLGGSEPASPALNEDAQVTKVPPQQKDSSTSDAGGSDDADAGADSEDQL